MALSASYGMARVVLSLKIVFGEAHWDGAVTDVSTRRLWARSSPLGPVIYPYCGITRGQVMLVRLAPSRSGLVPRVCQLTKEVDNK